MAGEWRRSCYSGRSRETELRENVLAPSARPAEPLLPARVSALLRGLAGLAANAVIGMTGNKKERECFCMGDVWLIVGCLGGAGVLYTIVLTLFGMKAEATPRPDLEEEEGKPV